jgi:hypothetical protein
MKQIRIFKNGNESLLGQMVNNFIKNCKDKIEDIQFSSTGSLISVYSVMIVIEDEK